MFKIILFISICISLFGCSCEDDTVTPTELKPGRRDYTWIVDTIKAGGNNMNSIDGISQNDVWVVGIPGDFKQTIHHFDGKQWKTDNINRPISTWSVCTLSANNVWCVGDAGEIWQYNGLSWQRNTKIVLNQNTYCSLYNVVGTDSNLYVVGSYSLDGSTFHSLLYHYNGTEWSRVQIGDYPVQLYKIKPFLQKEGYLILGSRDQQKLNEYDTSKIYEFDGINFKEIYSALEGRHGYGNFTPISNGMIISRGMKISISNGKAERDLVDVADDKFWNSFDARNEKDIILSMLDGIAHYNGTDIEYLYRFSGQRVHIHGVKIFEEAVFVIAHDYDMNTNYVFRGYLK